MLKLVDFSDSIIKVLGKSPLLILTCINESNLIELYFIYFTSLHKWRKMYFICWPVPLLYVNCIDDDNDTRGME